MTSHPHISVLYQETLASLNLGPDDIAIDCTVGAGGHTEGMLEAVGPSGKVIGLDRDQNALGIAQARLESACAAGRLTLVQAPFSDVEHVASAQGVQGQVSAVLADIGVSSMHIDQADRGFSFQKDGPLDMRMDRTQGPTAADLLASLPAEELARIFYEYGEEPQSRSIARRIVETRVKTPVIGTLQLADLVKSTVRYKTKSEKHPATKTFQALRIAVNDELGELKKLVQGGFDVLRPGGRLAIITFHSLEDRIVKSAFLDMTARHERAKIPRNLPLTEAQLQARIQARAEILKPFPILPTSEEIAANPRARSAKLRVLVKL